MQSKEFVKIVTLWLFINIPEDNWMNELKESQSYMGLFLLYVNNKA